MWGGSWYLRNYLYAAAQSGWDAWAVNLRGHGESPAPGGLERVSFLDYVDDVRLCLAGARAGYPFRPRDPEGAPLPGEPRARRRPLPQPPEPRAARVGLSALRA